MTDSRKAPRDRRSQHRAAMQIPATVQLGSETFDCSVRDLSVEGMAISHSGGAKLGSILRVVFRLPNSPQPIEVAGVLVRTEPLETRGAWGLRFVDPPAQAVRAISTYVARNRSDLPFSQRAGTAGGDLGLPSAASTRYDNTLKRLYEQAVDEASQKKPKRGWFRRKPRA